MEKNTKNKQKTLFHYRTLSKKFSTQNKQVHNLLPTFKKTNLICLRLTLDKYSCEPFSIQKKNKMLYEESSKWQKIIVKHSRSSVLSISIWDIFSVPQSGRNSWLRISRVFKWSFFPDVYLSWQQHIFVCRFNFPYNFWANFIDANLLRRTYVSDYNSPFCN